ncbi:ABC transporter permease [Pararhodobacter sp.]|uniref:ABC transporter permease n=1 Tax=Pararhodobacter sp. TaxID=2127056 RepID=UPI002AFF4887|nr:ABC transporter permease [Pararhodobacter sp.]
MASEGTVVGGDTQDGDPGPHPPVGVNRRHRALRAITALILREVSTRFGRTPGGFAWAVLQPLATIFVLGLAFSLIARTPALGTSFLLFKATGLLAYQTFQSNSMMVGKSLAFSAPLLTYPGVTWIDAILARFLLNTLVSVVVAVLILGGIIVALDLSLIFDWGAIVLAMALAALLGLGIGTLNCFLFERFAIWANLWGILNAPLMILSGVIVLYDDLPRQAQDWLWYNPAIHITGLMRAGFYSTYQPTYVSVAYVLAWALIPLALGLLLLRRYHRVLLTR